MPAGTAEGQAERVAVMSGGSRGVGRAIALELARKRMTVVLLHSPGGAGPAQDAVAHIRAINPAADAFPADVADEAQVAAALDRVVAQYGRLDVMINGAGYLRLTQIADLDLAELDRLHRTLIRSVFVVCQQAVRTMARGGAIINLSSVAVGLDVPGAAAYVAGKAAVEAMTRIAARELSERGISVNAVSMGLTEAESELVAAVSSTHPARADPLDQVGDIARTVAYLASPDGHWMTGHVVPASSVPR